LFHHFSVRKRHRQQINNPKKERNAHGSDSCS
jgi:hypothetical protein